MKCPDCDGEGTVYFSCCGDNMKESEYYDFDICPTCKEHLGGEEDCETCNGTGEIEDE